MHEWYVLLCFADANDEDRATEHGSLDLGQYSTIGVLGTSTNINSSMNTGLYPGALKDKLCLCSESIDNSGT